MRGESKERNTFWRVVSQIAVERFNMQEVFNMQSTVRLTAVESLGMGNLFTYTYIIIIILFVVNVNYIDQIIHI